MAIDHPIIFTDLDGTLLDHHTYSHRAADSLLAELNEHHIPVIPVSSKTRAELMQLRPELKNQNPFIIENGSAVVIPAGTFSKAPDNTFMRDSFWLYELSKPRAHWQKILAEIAPAPTPFISFSSAGTAGIAEMTGLTLEQAKLANQREYSEALQWNDTDSNKQKFVAALKKRGAQVLQGGRFMHVLGHCDKGLALQWLAKQYQKQWQSDSVSIIALGDSQNDNAMLEVADYPIQVRSPVHQFPELTTTQPVYQTQNFGPVGWVEAIRTVFYSKD